MRGFRCGSLLAVVGSTDRPTDQPTAVSPEPVRAALTTTVVGACGGGALSVGPAFID